MNLSLTKLDLFLIIFVSTTAPYEAQKRIKGESGGRKGGRKREKRRGQKGRKSGNHMKEIRTEGRNHREHEYNTQISKVMVFF